MVVAVHSLLPQVEPAPPQARLQRPQLLLSEASVEQVLPQAVWPDGQLTVAEPVVDADSDVAASLTLTVTVYVPGLEYLCDPVTLKEPFDPVMVPVLVAVPSPQSMVAERAVDGSETSASVTVATSVPENAVPAVAVTATEVAPSCCLQVPPMQLCPLGHTRHDAPQ
jgi:hypothetical protein